jgi:hypothetical protein
MDSMKMDIQKFTPDRLRAFIESQEYYSMPVIPVSYHRAVSWLNNPNLNSNDVILYLAIENDVMIGYRCILPDKLGSVKFGWLSGNWVNPVRRREGIATRLFDEAMKDWDNKLIYTNYASASHAVYNKTGCFNLYKELSGIRAYLRFDLARLLYPKGMFFKRIRILLQVLDGIFNFFNDFRLKLYRKEFTLAIPGLQIVNEIDHQLEDFISTRKNNRSFFRKQQELNWIIRFPWVIEQQGKNDLYKKYYFTSTAGQYCNLNLKMFDEHNQLILYMMLVIIDKKMTVPYAYFDTVYINKAVDIILSFMLDKKVNYVTLYNPELVTWFSRRGLPFLFKKKMIRKYFTTRDLINILPPAGEIFLQDGDGDCVFT